ncbi:cation:proton antiporter [Bacillus massilinigeriensis]|uniref:cation:proton antiporter n=1 Tax=Bacillus mediterraneensis TaxID=1805474 RepID=UPI0008F80016|nr:cation:proton antiporter [Bacillus mediterraneensis]
MNLLLATGLFLLILFFVGIIGTKVINLPDILLYIILGLVLSNIFNDNKVIETAGEMGLVLLFFILGMDFSVNRLKKNGRRVWKAGLLDVLLGIGVTMLICKLFGLDWVSSLLIGGIVYATSSSITAKLLQDKNRTENKESEFLFLILIFEDLIAPILVTVLIGVTGKGFSPYDFGSLLLKVIVMAAIAVLFAKIVMKKAEPILKNIRNDDIFIVLIAGVALCNAGIAVFFGLSEVIGAFLAGLMFSETSMKDKIEKVAMPLRNVLLPFFFLNFGTHVKLTGEIPYPVLLAVLVGWSIIHKVAVGYFGGRWYGLSGYHSLTAGLSLTQRGEFSVIIAGLAAGALNVFASIYILIITIIGTILFQLAPKLNKLVYDKKIRFRQT